MSKYTITFKVKPDDCYGEFLVDAESLEDAIKKAREKASKPAVLAKDKTLTWNDFGVEIDGVLG